MKKLLSLLVLLFVFTQISFAQVKAGDMFIAPRLALGGVGEASLGYGLSGEYLLSQNLGVGFVGMYSGYTEEVNYVFYSGKWSYSNIYILGMVTYHYDVFGSPSFDTYGSFNIGYNVASAKWEWNVNPGGIPAPSASVGGLVWGFTATMRYFVTPSIAVFASAGYGIGYLHVGVDFKL
ncbi:MAG: hypothetical protein N3F03_04100 [Ignavibacteria bacterium]|nr:hypothetical protein [Ignavibacteria bacterium]